MNRTYSGKLPVIFYLCLCAIGGVAMALLYDDSCQQDGGLHFLFAKWAWAHHGLFVGVWSRPLFTTIYAIPALIGYRAARIFTVIVCLNIAWQTYKLASDLKIDRSPIAILFVWLQPSFFLFSADNLTEPIFALVFVIALRLHLSGHKNAGMFVGSLMILARPEGFFLGVLWGIWILRDAWKDSLGDLKAFVTNAGRASLLASGGLIWWLAALLITGDPLFIKNNWPPNWPMTGTIYGAAGLIAYPIRLPEIVGPFLLPLFIYGLVSLIRRRQLGTITSSFLLFFILHTFLRAFGLLGSAGYPRYLVAISPAIALITLTGWNKLADLFSGMTRWIAISCAVVILALSGYINFVYADGAEWSRDAVAINQLHQWFTDNPQPVNKLIFSEPYSCIIFNRDPWENIGFTLNRDVDMKTLAESPPGTLVVWDEKVGPKWYGLKADDFEAAGFSRIYSKSFVLRGRILDRSWFGFGGPRHQTFYLLYKKGV